MFKAPNVFYRDLTFEASRMASTRTLLLQHELPPSWKIPFQTSIEWTCLRFFFVSQAAHFGARTRGHYERVFSLEESLESLEISQFSRISRTWSDFPLFSAVGGGSLESLNSLESLESLNFLESLHNDFSEKIPPPVSEPEH